MRLTIGIAEDGRTVTIRADRYGSDIKPAQLARLIAAGLARHAGAPATPEHPPRRSTDPATTDADEPPYRKQRYTPDELLDEWDYMRTTGVRWSDFAARVGISHRCWERVFRRAHADGDPRAVRDDHLRLA
ncbi:MAG: hypothetical protein L0H84_21705 [Pseudonocardia sp.]|nr:hypothetical protein [Pseudonocardia sp.]